MAKDKSTKKITIDEVEYDLNKLSDDAKTQLANIEFVDSQLQKLNSEWAVADTARMAYNRALKAELANNTNS